MKKKWNISSSDAAPMLAVFHLAINFPALRFVYHYIQSMNEPNISFGISIGIGLFILEYILFEVVVLPKIYKWFLNFFIFLDLVCLYFMVNYKLVINKELFLSLLSTSKREVVEYISAPNMLCLAAIFLFLFVIWKMFHVQFSPFKKELRRKTITVSFLVFVFVLNIFLFSKEYAFFFRQEKIFKHLILPLNYLDALYGGIRTSLAKNRPLHDIHSQSHLNSKIWSQIKQKTVYVLIIGETAREQNFSLNHYLRETNPNLKKINNLISFHQTFSCGTSTATSVPCLFDFRGRKNFVDDSENYTNLLDIAQTSDFEVTWIDNNTGCQGVCDRVNILNLRTLVEAKDLCTQDNCYDLLLLAGLKKAIENSSAKKQLIVLHMLGSHGPKYYKRYPEKFAHFRPDCRQEDLTQCTNEQIRNSYDNTIIYTDYVLAETIHYLENLKSINSQLTYISDHGESLGEKGLYLHAMPYRFAPEEQTHVPFLFWANSSFLSNFHIDLDCLNRKQEDSLSHDFIFHSYLRLLGIDHTLYKKDRDLFKSCMKGFL